MIQLTGAGKRFGHKVLFENLDWLVNTKHRIGLVGGNGTSKSTLLKVLRRMEQFDSGSWPQRFQECLSMPSTTWKSGSRS